MVRLTQTTCSGDLEMPGRSTTETQLCAMTSSQIDRLILDLGEKLGVTSVVVTHEMDSAFRIADRMIMLDEGVVLLDAKREDFEAIRDGRLTGGEKIDLIRQFLRGDSEGPITQRRQDSGYEEDILNAAGDMR